MHIGPKCSILSIILQRSDRWEVNVGAKRHFSTGGQSGHTPQLKMGGMAIFAPPPSCARFWQKYKLYTTKAHEPYKFIFAML